ncbi:MAG: hypothetical protein K5908_04885 [Erysipelotrichaceae bacterium]|nr:hypothetical protein [Erysipelotrichaceae bacterium]
MIPYNADELREELRNYYGTAAVVMGQDDPFGGIPVLSDLFDVDSLSDEEVVGEAERLGIIWFLRR